MCIRDSFQKVQDILQAASEARQTSMQKTEEIRATLVNLFEGKIVCADCGKKMYFHRKRIDKDKRKRWYAYYECSTSVGRRYEHCTSHYTRPVSYTHLVFLFGDPVSIVQRLHSAIERFITEPPTGEPVSYTHLKRHSKHIAEQFALDVSDIIQRDFRRCV